MVHWAAWHSVTSSKVIAIVLKSQIFRIRFESGPSSALSFESFQARNVC